MITSPSRRLLLCLAAISAAFCGAARAAGCPPKATEALELAGSTLCLYIDDPSPARRALLRTWVARSADIVAGYYGRFPATRVDLDLDSAEGDGVGGGRTTDDPGLLIHVAVGRLATAEKLSNDWVLVHEMVHLALPEVGRMHNWLAEGLAVYVEGIARAQAGNRDVADVWAEARHSMPMGLPRGGEGGMDQTRTWARTYWGGALFCLQADVAIREHTSNRVGLQTALRAILEKTGGYASDRDIRDVLEIGGAATGTHVLQELYRAGRETPHTPNLDAMWSRLGVPSDPKTEPFDNHAPLAAIRIAITAPSARPNLGANN